MPQAQVARFPGFGVVYPDGINGIKIIRTYVQAPKKIIQSDGSVEYTTPPPTIYELYGGGFAYASGEPVTDRGHLESIGDPKMRDRALKWFDGHGELSKVAKEGIPQFDAEALEKKKPEPVYVISSDMGHLDEPEKQVNEQPKGPMPMGADHLSQVLSAISSLAETVKAQGTQISDLQKASHPTPDMVKISAARKHQSESMKARWAAKKAAAKEQVIPEVKSEVDNGKDTPKTD